MSSYTVCTEAHRSKCPANLQHSGPAREAHCTQGRPSNGDAHVSSSGTPHYELHIIYLASALHTESTPTRSLASSCRRCVTWKPTNPSGPFNNVRIGSSLPGFRQPAWQVLRSWDRVPQGGLGIYKPYAQRYNPFRCIGVLPDQDLPESPANREPSRSHLRAPRGFQLALVRRFAHHESDQRFQIRSWQYMAFRVP